MANTLPKDNINPNEKSHTFSRSEEDAKAARSERRKTSGSQQKPLLLQREVSPPRPFPFEALGTVLGGAAKRCYEVIKAPDAICGQAFLAAASLAVQAYANVSIDGRYHPLSLYLMTIGESGSRKSAVDGIALSPIRQFEKTLVDTYEKDQPSYEIELSIWKAKNELAIKDQAKKKKACNEKTPNDDLVVSLDRPEAPLFPNILVEEPTFEGLFHLFKNGNPSLGLFSDEGGRMIGGHGMNSDNQLKTCCGLSTLWDGNKPLTNSRRGDGTSALYGRRLASHLMMQEVVLRKILSNEVFTEQGFLARFLIAVPSSNAGNRAYQTIDLSADPLLEKYRSRMSEILDTPFHLASGKANELEPRGLYLSPDAKRRWITFHDEVDSKLKPDGALYPIRRMANKAAEQVLRIAGVLTLFEMGLYASDISFEMIERGIALVRFYFDEALRIDEVALVDRELETAQKVLDWMRSKAQGNTDRIFTLQEIYQRGGPRDVRNKSRAQVIMNILKEHGCVEQPNQNSGYVLKMLKC